MPRGRLGGHIGGFFFSVVSTRGNGLVHYHIYLVGLHDGISSIGGVHQTVSLLALPLQHLFTTDRTPKRVKDSIINKEN